MGRRKVFNEGEIVEIIEKYLPQIIDKNPQIRLKIEELLEKKAATKDDIKIILQELSRQYQEINTRFETFVEDINKRFEVFMEQTNNRFEVFMKEIDKRFEESDKRFDAFMKETRESLQESNKRFEAFMKETQEANKRFETFIKETQETNKRFETFIKETQEANKRFDAFIKEAQEANKRFEAFIKETRETFQEINKRFEAFMKETRETFQEANRRFEAFMEATNKRFEEVIKEMREGFKALKDLVVRVGARWGIFAEEAFREAMKGILEELGFYKVDKWRVYDKDGFVFGYSCVIEVDLAIVDNKHFLIEIKSSVSDGDVWKLKRIGEFYENQTKIKPNLVLVSPFISQEAKEKCNIWGVKFYTAL